MLDRVGDWEKFSRKVKDHIEEYTIPQYQSEDGEGDQASNWTAVDCVQAIRKYEARFGKGARGRAEEMRDMLKIAHYAQLAYDKLIGEG